MSKSNMMCAFWLFLSCAAGALAQSFSATPVNDLGTGTYLGFEGGLYENGSNVVPGDHNQAGLSLLSRIVPIRGQTVLLGIGMSNAADVFGAFVRQANGNPGVDHNKLSIVNGAEHDQVA